MRQADCIFCKIIAGEIPSNTIYEDDTFKVILDASPASKGHALILPKKHYAIFSVSCLVFSASWRISSATTAKPLPASPALALSIDALSARRLV